MRQTCKHWKSGIEAVNAPLAPLGFPWHYSSFSCITAANFATRGHAHALTSEELAAVCAASTKLHTLNLSGAFQLSSLLPLGHLGPSLRRLALNDSAVTDEHVAGVLGSLPCLQDLSLRGCGFLRGDFLPRLGACPELTRLDLANCGLSLHLNPAAAEALAQITSLLSLDLGGGNGVADASVVAIAALPCLLALGLRGAAGLTEGGLEALAAGPAARQLLVLDLEGCSGLSDACWPALSRLQALQDLSLARLPHLLRFQAMAEQHAAALWRWPRLRRLCLAGSAPHPSKLKLLAATCGGGLQELDLSAPSAAAAGAPGSHRGCFARLPQQQVRDLQEAARHLRQLRVLSAAGTGLPAEAAVAFMRATPRLEQLDLSGCSPAARPSPRLCGQLWTSGVFVPAGAAEHRVAGAGAGAVLAGGGAEPCAAEFAAALGALTALRVLRLEGCGSLSDQHLACLSSLSALEEVSVARNRGVGDASLSALAASGAALRTLDIGGTAATDAGLQLLARQGLQELRVLKLARCGALLMGASLAAVAASSQRCLRELDVSDCSGIDDAGMAAIANGFSLLCKLHLAGCSAVGPTGLRHVAALRRLTHLDAARCKPALTDDTLCTLCEALTQLTALDLGGAAQLTSASLTTLGTLRCLAAADLTCCSGMGADAELAMTLPGVTLANVQLPQGTAAATGSPIKRRPGSAAIGRPLPAVECQAWETACE